jgi:hypothetical protein
MTLNQELKLVAIALAHASSFVLLANVILKITNGI